MKKSKPRKKVAEWSNGSTHWAHDPKIRVRFLVPSVSVVQRLEQHLFTVKTWIRVPLGIGRPLAITGATSVASETKQARNWVVLDGSRAEVVEW